MHSVARLGHIMRTSIDIPEELIEEVRLGYGVETKRAAVVRALEEAAARQRRQRLVDASFGIGWDSDLDVLREGWS